MVLTSDLDFVLLTLIMVDVHSIHSQFNTRKPRAGPLPPQKSTSKVLRGLVATPPPSADLIPNTKMNSVNNLERVIKTNSRIQKDEKFKKNMYLTFVTNALREKREVRILQALRRYLIILNLLGK